MSIATIEWSLMLKYVTRPKPALDRYFTHAMVRGTRVFLGIDGVIAVTGTVNVLLLSKLAGEIQVGLYSAANQLLVPVTLCYTNAVLSVYPTMCRRFGSGFNSLKQIATHLIELLLALAFPTAIGLFCAADWLLSVVYGHRDFGMSVGALRIMVWNVIPIALTTVLGQVLVAALRERVTLRIVVIDGLVSFLIGIVLVPRFGVNGAALTAVFMRIVDLFQHYIPVSRLFSTLRLDKLLWKPAVAGACMAGYLFAISNERVLLNLVSAVLVYSAVWFALTLWSSGGPSQLKIRYLSPWLE